MLLSLLISPMTLTTFNLPLAMSTCKDGMAVTSKITLLDSR